MPAVLVRVRSAAEELEPFHDFEFFLVSLRQQPTALDEAVQLRELMDADPSLDIRHRVFKPRSLDGINRRFPTALALPGARSDSMETKQAHEIRPFGVPRHDQPALAGGDRLDRMKAVHRRVADRADLPSLVFSAERVRGVL